MRELSVLVIMDSGDRSKAGLLTELQLAGVRLRVLGASNVRAAGELIKAGVPFQPLGLRSVRDDSGIETIRWHIDDFRPHVLHLMQPRPMANGLIAAKGRPVEILAHRDMGQPRLRDPLILLNRRVSRIVCEAEADRQALLRLSPLLRLPPHKVVTISRGYDIAWYRSAPLDLAPLGVPRSAFVVTCAADLRQPRNVVTIVRASDHLPADLPIHFLLIGAGRGVARIGRLTARSRYRDRFHVLGSRVDASQVLAASAVILLPAPDAESLDSVVEAMAYEATPIVGDAGGGAELLEHARSGLVVPSGDAKAWAGSIMRLYNDRETCRELGRNARRRVAHDMSVRKSATRMLSLYRELVAEP